MLDSDLAELYEVPTKRLNEQVRRNLKRFPPAFMFQLNAGEVVELKRSQFATGSQIYWEGDGSWHEDGTLLPGFRDFARFVMPNVAHCRRSHVSDE